MAGQLGAPFALILSIIFLGDRIGLPRLAGIVMAFAGVMLLAFDPAAVDNLPGLALPALSTVFWAISSLLQRKLAGVPVPVLYAWIGFIGAAVLDRKSTRLNSSHSCADRMQSSSWITKTAVKTSA